MEYIHKHIEFISQSILKTRATSNLHHLSLTYILLNQNKSWKKNIV